MPKKKEPRSAPKLGATYTNAKMVVQVASPLTDIGLLAAEQPGSVSAQNLVPGLKARATSGTAAGIASAALQRWGDKKIGQANALSRHSLTAFAGEAIPVLQAFDARGSARHAHDAYVRASTGLTPSTATFSLRDSKGYLFTKYGLGIVRKLVNKTRIAEPVKKALSMMGVTL